MTTWNYTHIKSVSFRHFVASYCVQINEYCYHYLLSTTAFNLYERHPLQLIKARWTGQICVLYLWPRLWKLIFSYNDSSLVSGQWAWNWYKITTNLCVCIKLVNYTCNLSGFMMQSVGCWKWWHPGSTLDTQFSSEKYKTTVYFISLMVILSHKYVDPQTLNPYLFIHSIFTYTGWSKEQFTLFCSGSFCT